MHHETAMGQCAYFSYVLLSYFFWCGLVSDMFVLVWRILAYKRQQRQPPEYSAFQILVESGVWQYQTVCDPMSLTLKFLAGNLLASRKDYCFFFPPKKQCFKFRNLFFLVYKDTFIYIINLEELKKLNWLRFLCVFKDMVVERSKNILKICPNLLHF